MQHPYDTMSANEIAQSFDGMFAACTGEDELNTCAACMDGTHPKMSGELVSYITASYENALSRIRRAIAVNRDETARDMTHRAYMGMVGSTMTGAELERYLIDRLVRNRYARSYAARIVREYLDA